MSSPRFAGISMGDTNHTSLSTEEGCRSGRTAIKEAVLVFPTPGVPVIRMLGCLLCGPSSLMMVYFLLGIGACVYSLIWLYSPTWSVTGGLSMTA